MKIVFLKSARTFQNNGTTLLETIIAISIGVIVILGVGVYIVNIHRGWGNVWRRVNSEVVRDAYDVRKAFYGIIRKSARYYTFTPDGSSVEVNYWNDPKNNTSVFPDRYARFYSFSNQLLLERGSLDPKTEISTTILADDVTQCKFTPLGNTVQIFLTIDDGEQVVSVYSSAMMHNSF